MKRVLAALGLLALSGCALVPGSTAGSGSLVPAPTGPSTSPIGVAWPAEAPPTRTPETASGEITIGWVGDITMGSQYGLPPGNGSAMFAQVTDLLNQPDLMWGNLEGALSDRPASICSPRTASATPTLGADGSPTPAPTPPPCFAFVAPPGNAAGLKAAGFDGVNVANNHGYDAGAAGLADTVASVRAQRLAVSGLTPEVTVVTTKGVRVAFVGFSTQSWWHLTTDLPTVKRVVAQAAKAADVVVVTIHGGAEGSDKTHTPQGSEIAFSQERGYLPTFARTAVDAGADVILGSGPHVLRGIEIYRHRLIAYSLGNFAGNHNFVTGGDLSLTGLLNVRVDAQGVLHGATFHSLSLTPQNWPTKDPSNSALRLIQQMSNEDFHGTGAKFDQAGHLLNR